MNREQQLQERRWPTSWSESCGTTSTFMRFQSILPATQSRCCRICSVQNRRCSERHEL